MYYGLNILDAGMLNYQPNVGWSSADCQLFGRILFPNLDKAP